MTGKHKGQRWACLGLGLALAVGLALGLRVPTAQAHANYERSNPPANGRLEAGKPPAQVQVWFSENIEARFSELTALDKDGHRVDGADSRLAVGDPKSMLISLKPGLPDGPYTVIYKNASAEDGHTVKGSFAFVVGIGTLPAVAGSSPLDLARQQDGGSNENANFWTVSLRWLNYLAGAAVVGSLLYLLLVWRPAVGRARATKRMGPQLETAYGLGVRRAARVIGLGLIGLGLGWLGWLINQAASFSGQTPFQLFGIGVDSGKSGPTALRDFLLDSRYGLIWLARLVLLALLGVVFRLARSSGPGNSLGAALLGGRLPGTRRLRQNLLPAEESGPVGPVSSPAEPSNMSPEGLARQYGKSFEARRGWWWGVAGLGAAVLLTNSLVSHAAGVAGWAWLAIAGDWLHLLSTATWIGGLLAMASGLAVAIPALLPGSGDRTRLLASLIPAFSQVAILSVMVLLVTGTFQAALHLGDLTDLFSTPYGLGLSLKIGLLLPLLLLAAYNLLVVSPRMRAFARSKKAGPKEGAGSVAAGLLGLNFRRAVLAEIALAALILLASAFLTSNAPPKALASTGGVLFFQSAQSGLAVQMAISPGVVGDNTFEVELKDVAGGRLVSTARLVDLRLTMLDMDMGTPQLELKPSGSNTGRYLAQGSILSMGGNWRANILIQRDGQEDVTVPVTFKVK